MANLAYQYLSDDGSIYQIVLPSDFATALSYIPASGSEPALPTYVSARYSTYMANRGLVLNAVVNTVPFNVNSPPQNIIVGSTPYVLRSSYGEQRGFAQIPAIMTVSGPQGPAGAAGAAGATGATGATGPAGTSGVLSVSSAAQVTSGAVATASFSSAASLSLAAGSYILFAIIAVTSTQSSPWNVQLELFNSTDSAVIGLPTQDSAAGATPKTFVCIGSVVLAGTKTIVAQCKASLANVAFSGVAGNGLLAIKYA
jgi:hypothetical protein